MRHALGVGKLVTETALEPAAQAGELRWIQAQVLLLGHLDRDGLERLQERRAAERTAAGTVPAVHLGLVANTDLPHLDPRPELRRELAHELAEVDPAVGGEIEEQLRSVERLLDACQLHPQSALADLQERDAKRLLLTVLVLQAGDDVFLARQPHDALRRVLRRTPFRLELWDPAHDGPDRRATFRLHDNTVAGPGDRLRRMLAEQDGLGPADGRQLDGDERHAARSAHGTPSIYMYGGHS